MTWTPITDAEMTMARNVVTYIRTAKAIGYGGPDWLPSDADLSKSALLERLRSGKEPLAEPPPLGMSCPWYAVVEDKGPHYVFDVWRGGMGFTGTDQIVALQHIYKIVVELGQKSFIVRDDRTPETSYRFRLWYDPEWTHPSHQRGVGAWFMQNVAFEK
jgi:hypothetical protein